MNSCLTFAHAYATSLIMCENIVLTAKPNNYSSTIVAHTFMLSYCISDLQQILLLCCMIN